MKINGKKYLPPQSPLWYVNCGQEYSLFKILENAVINNKLKHMSNDTKSTILGIIAASVVASKIDWVLLLQGDPNQVGTFVGVIVTAILGFYINKKDSPKTE